MCLHGLHSPARTPIFKPKVRHATRHSTLQVAGNSFVWTAGPTGMADLTATAERRICFCAGCVQTDSEPQPDRIIACARHTTAAGTVRVRD